MRRADLRSEILYFDCASEQYFYTPNPPGVIWLTPTEAELLFDIEVETVLVSNLSEF